MRIAVANGGLAQREPAVSLDPAEVFRRYRGFDGDVWPGRDSEGQFADAELTPMGLQLSSGLAPLSRLQQVLSYRERIDKNGECDVIGIRPTEQRRKDFINFDDWPSGFTRVGLDIGFFDSEWSHYSCTLNEILWGTYPELRRFGDRLNKNLLFDDYQRIDEFLVARSRLLATGADVEKENTMKTFQIFAFNG